jgi:hypothetical protein
VDWKALEQMLRVRLRTCFKINESKQTVFGAARIALISGADRFLDGFETTLSRQTLGGGPRGGNSASKSRWEPTLLSSVTFPLITNGL